MRRIALSIGLITCSILGWAQNGFYHIDSIPEIKIYFAQDNWDELLDALFIAGDEQRLECDLEIDGTVLPGCGIRYKGFSSSSINYVKNPFNIKLDYVDAGQTYSGIDKIKLSNVIQDPSFVREALSYEIARQYMPAGEANFAKVFVNDEYWGLYTNVEAVDKSFLNDHFTTVSGSFFKCNPASLNLFGENANLSDSPGMAESDYFDIYDLKSDAGWGDLVGMIDVLNNDVVNVEPQLNIDRALWMHAFNYAVVNFDSYIGYAQNYYLYQDMDGQFQPILWDLNMSFASYRLSDDSDFWDGFTIDQAKTIDPLAHLESVSVFPRPMMRKFFEQDTYKRMFLAHLRTIVEENFSSGTYLQSALDMQELIDQDVQDDVNKFYTYEDFQLNLTSTTSDLINYPGISDLIEARTEYLLDYEGIPNSPEIGEVVAQGPIGLGDNLVISAPITNATQVILAYRFGGTGLFSYENMTDDGSGLYSNNLYATGNAIQYYIYAENAEAGRFSPERAAYEYYELTSEVSPGDLVINEFMADNVSHVLDDDNDYDDWVELYNNTPYPISTSGLYLSDNDTNVTKWAMPNVTIPSASYLIVWADENGNEGSLHANFQLASTTGEWLGLSYSDDNTIDSLTYDVVDMDQSLARFPNGTGPFVEMSATFNAPNNMVSVEEIEALELGIYPNPNNGEFVLSLDNKETTQLNVYSLLGELVYSSQLSSELTSISVPNLASGIYQVVISKGQKSASQKLIISN